MKKTTLIFLAFNFLIIFPVLSQGYTRNIRGQVIDRQSQIPLPGANIIISDSDPLVGVATDINGYFVLENVPIGRINLQASYLGYLPSFINNINLTSGKDIILTIELDEEVFSADEVEIVASRDKSRSINEMASVSARQFSVEETQRFAGARNDVSRMASRFAGVSSNNDAVNDIIIRGNSPNGLLWRLEGIDVPNPNHFGQMGASGGPVSMLNNNVLANSDFMTSAFPAEYGNALSGVFDIKMRTGNYEKYEFLAQIGFNGLEAGVEGPISRKNNSSFVANYRYSTLGVMAALGINVGTGNAVPYYQDLSFNVNLPTKKAGRFTIFGLGGINHITFENSTLDSTEYEGDFYADENTDIRSKGKLGVLGLTHTYLINASTYTKVILSGSYMQQYSEVDSIIQDSRETVPYNRRDLQNINLLTSFYLNKKFNAKNNFRVGIKANSLNYNLIDSTNMGSDEGFKTYRDERDGTWFMEAYAEWQHKFNDMLVLYTGLHYQTLVLNGSWSLEPRLGLNWTWKAGNTISLGYGMHSRTQMLQVYFVQYQKDDGSFYQPNLDLGLTKAHHFVLGYDWVINPSLRFKAETYYQYLYEAPVERVPSNFSMLNASSMMWQVPDSLVSSGPGRNYGLDLSFEKFMSHGLYFLFTGSIYKSTYKGSKGEWRSTAFDSRYVFNAVGGKEWEIHTKRDEIRRFIDIDLHFTTAGGRRYTAVDVEASQEKNQTVYNDDEAFSKQYKPYLRMDIRAAFRMDFKKTSHEIAVDIQNVTNRQNPLYMQYNKASGQEDIIYQIGIFPMVQYKVIF